MDDMFQNYTPGLPGQASDLEAVTPQPDQASRLAFRVLRQLQAQSHSAQAAALILAGDGSDVPASRIDGLTVRVAAPSPHAGHYRVSLAALARGPVCLVPPALRDVGGEGAQLVAEAGLWVTDAACGQPVVLGQWLADGAVLDGAVGMALTLDSTHAGRNIAYAETVRQGGFETVGQSATFLSPPAAVAPPAVVAIAATPDVTLQAGLASDEPVEITVTAPPEYAGEYTLDPADLAAGPVCLVAPGVIGNSVAGSVLTTSPGLWVHDADAGPLVVSRQWFVGEEPVEDAGVLTHTRATIGTAPRYVETATDASGSRTSAAVLDVTVALGALPDTFTAPDGTLLSAYVGESGIGWHAGNIAVVESGALRNRMAFGWYLQPRMDDLPADQYVEADVIVGTGDQMTSLALRINEARTEGYMVLVRTAGIQVARKSPSTGAPQLAGGNIAGSARAAGTAIKLRLEAQGTALRLYLDGALIWSGTDATLAGGHVGIVANGAVAYRNGSYITNFHAGVLA